MQPPKPRKPFEVKPQPGSKPKRFGVVCIGKGMRAFKPFPIPDTTLLITFFMDDEAQRLADALNQTFADFFDV